MTASRAFDILDVPVDVTGSGEDLAYVDAFVDAYEGGANGGAAREARVTVQVRRDAIDREEPAERLWIHRSKHAYWDVQGSGRRGNAVRWLNRPVLTAVDGDAAVVLTPPGEPPEMTGEAAWHVCRSLALYARDAREGKLLHASAACFGDTAVLFVGDVSAGKTTFMTECVLGHGAQPLANDRVLVRLGDPLEVRSWPSYASFTEGTLLDYEPLHAAALEYEAGRTGHRTQSWGTRLRRAYTKDAKRVFPMSWLSRAVGRRYARGARLGGLVLGTLAPGIEDPVVERLDLGDPGIRAPLADLLASQCFDQHEPSFCPWHGRSLPTGAASAPSLVSILAERSVPVVRLRAPAPGLRPWLDRALREVL